MTQLWALVFQERSVSSQEWSSPGQNTIGRRSLGTCLELGSILSSECVKILPCHEAGQLSSCRLGPGERIFWLNHNTRRKFLFSLYQPQNVTLSYLLEFRNILTVAAFIRNFIISGLARVTVMASLLALQPVVLLVAPAWGWGSQDHRDWDTATTAPQDAEH